MTMPAKPRIVGLGGTLRERSYSRAALKETLRLAEARDAETELLDLRELDLPMYVPDLPVEGYLPQHQAAIKRLLDSCRRANAMLWASPTYHGTVSGVFKNALDMIELLCDDEPPYLAGRAVGLIVVSDSNTFATMSNAASELRAWLAPTYLTFEKDDFNADLTLKGGRPARRASRLVGDLLSFTTAERLNGHRRLPQSH